MSERVHFEDPEESMDPLSLLAETLEHALARERQREDREYRRAFRDYLTGGLIAVRADEEDLRCAGVDPEAAGTIFDFSSDFDWEAEKLWEIRGDGTGFCYGYHRGRTATEWVTHGRYYLFPEQAAKVNAIRAKKYLNKGGSVEEAEQMEGGWRFDRNFIAAVRAEARARDAALPREEAVPDKGTGESKATPGAEAATRAGLNLLGAVLGYHGVVTIAYSKRKLAGISAFLVLTALGVMLGGPLTDALAVGLAGWGVTSLVMWLLQRKVIKATERVVEDAGHDAGIEGSVADAADVAALAYLFGGAKKS